MKYRAVDSIRAVVCALCLTAPASAQTQAARIVASPEASPALRGHLLREAVDPCLGQHWQWIADPLHPERPYRLVLIDSAMEFQQAESPKPASASDSAPQRMQPASSALVIRAGEIVTVHQETGAVRAQLQALALDVARAGQPLRVRLLVTSDRSAGMNFVLTSPGPIVTVVALSSGQAQWPGSSTGSVEEAGR